MDKIISSNPNPHKCKCSNVKCSNEVEIHKSSNYEFSSKHMFKTATGYRNKYSNFPLNHFCSGECMSYFIKYNCCAQCDEDCRNDGKGIFIEELNHTLCTYRGDMEPSCVSKYILESCIKQEYKNCGYYPIDTIVLDELLSHSCDKIKQVIASNGNMISYNMLKRMHMFSTGFEVQDKDKSQDILVDEKTFYEYYNKIKDGLL